VAALVPSAGTLKDLKPIYLHARSRAPATLGVMATDRLSTTRLRKRFMTKYLPAALGLNSDVDGFHSTGDGAKRDGVSQRESRY
jgi:hypothetical protein